MNICLCLPKCMNYILNRGSYPMFIIHIMEITTKIFSEAKICLCLQKYLKHTMKKHLVCGLFKHTA